MTLPLVLAGPILRRVEPNLVAVWIALRDACTLKLSLWENQLNVADAEETNLWFRSPDPGTKTVRVGEKLHIAVVAVTLPSGKTLVPERLYSYDLEITPQNQTTKETLKSLGLLNNDPPNADPDGDNAKHLALGYEVDLLPCLVLPPKELTDLRIVHGSCRDTDNDFPDGLAWLDDLISVDKAYESPLKRPHQLFMTGDQIYADEVPRPLLNMLNATAQTLFGATVEQLPFTDAAQPTKVATVPATLANFPVGHRHNLIVNEAGMTTTDGSGHLLSFGEFCAMYLYVWSNVCWEDQLKKVPPPDQLPPTGTLDQIAPPALRDLITKNFKGDVSLPSVYDTEARERDVARLTEFHRTLPKVRRALANVPTYLIFDDHEITDDWFLNPTWRDRVLGSPLGSAIIRNGMLAYALFQGWGNDPAKFAPRPGLTEKQPHEQLLEQVEKFMPAGATTGPNADAAKEIERLLGLDKRNQIAADGTWAETEPPLKWHYTVPGEKHGILVLDCRTRRAFASRISPPGNIGLTAQAEQIPEKPDPADKQVWLVISSLPVLGPPIFDELFAPLLYRAFDFKDRNDLKRNRGTANMPTTNPDAVEAWAFDPKLFEALLKRLVPYSPVLLLSGDVHYSASNAMSYWTDKAEPARFVQLISSGFKNIMPETIRFIDRSFAFAQRMIRAKIGAERLGWAKNSPAPVTPPEGVNVSPRLRRLLAKSPVMIPTTGWPNRNKDNKPEGTRHTKPDWAWRVCPLRDARADAERPNMARAFSLFPDDASKKDDDLTRTDLEGYHRAAERHQRQLDRLSNCRQILFASSLALVTFQKRTEKDKDGHDVEILYATQDLYTIQRDPQELIARPKPLLYARHEAALRDVWQQAPAIPQPKDTQ